jgi:hypothetical protein
MGASYVARCERDFPKPDDEHEQSGSTVRATSSAYCFLQGFELRNFGDAWNSLMVRGIHAQFGNFGYAFLGESFTLIVLTQLERGQRVRIGFRLLSATVAWEPQLCGIAISSHRTTGEENSFMICQCATNR